MFIKFDYKCTVCDAQGERFVRRKEMDRQFCCDVQMLRLPPATKTHFRYADTKLKD